MSPSKVQSAPVAAGKIRAVCLSGPRRGRGWKAGRSRGAFLRSWNPGSGAGAASAGGCQAQGASTARRSAPPTAGSCWPHAGRAAGTQRTTCPRGGIARISRSNDGAGRGAEDAGPGALRRRGRRGWEGAGREVVPGARPRMLAAPAAAAAAAAAALGAAPGLGRSLRAPLGLFAGNGDARSGRGLGRAVPACAA